MKYEYQKFEHLEGTVIHDEFWSVLLEKLQNIMIPYVFEKFETLDGFYNNFVNLLEGKKDHYGNPFDDGLIYEALRGASDFLAIQYDANLDKLIDKYIDIIEKVQELDKDGYIHTYVTMTCPEYRWSQNGGNLMWQHDVWTAGCLIEAGVHHYRSTKKTRLLKCGIKFANYMISFMGESPKSNIVPAHSLPEEAVVKLYQLFKEEPGLKVKIKDEYDLDVYENEYLQLCRFWLENRGNHKDRISLPESFMEYCQDQRPLLETTQAVGHAVRAVLLYTGAAAYGMASGDKRFLDCVRVIWRHVLSRQIYVSGGVGSVPEEEKFYHDYNLDHVGYLETCAGVGMAFWAGEMHSYFGESEYIDTFEQVVYNNVLSAISQDGVKYFYRNPLESAGDVERWDWHQCPCCPPMMLKLFSILKNYIYSQTDDKLFVNLHIGSEVKTRISKTDIEINQSIKSYLEKNNTITISTKEPCKFTLAIRVPSWSEGLEILVNDEQINNVIKDGYVLIERVWHLDKVTVIINYAPFRWISHPYHIQAKGCIALQYGPILYCIEDADNKSLDITIDKNDDFILEDGKISNTSFKYIVCKNNGCVKFKAIPYYLWNNRGKGKMKVWIKSNLECNLVHSVNDNLYKKMPL